MVERRDGPSWLRDDDDDDDDNPQVRLLTYTEDARSVSLDFHLGTLLLLDASLNISTSSNYCSAPCAFEVILQLTRYINYLLTYLLTYLTSLCVNKLYVTPH